MANDSQDPKKKDLTDILEFAEKEPFTPPPGSEMEPALEMQKIEAIDSFESLDQYSASHPAETEHPESAPESFEATPTEDSGFESVAPPEQIEEITNNDAAPPLDDPFASNEAASSGTQAGSWTQDPDVSPEPTFDSSATDTPQEDTVSQDEAPLREDFTPTEDSPPHGDFAATETITAAADKTQTFETLVPAPSLAPEPARKSNPFDQVKEYSERLTPGNPTVAASFPFSLLITGALTPHEKEKLTDLLARENMGIREVDLEPQFESNRVLIPRISEYAGILLVQALRGTQATMQLGPSDTIFATDDTRSKVDESTLGSGAQSSLYLENEFVAAERLPITTDGKLPGYSQYTVIDSVSVSAALKTIVVETERSSQYQETLDALQRELKHKAYRKGATAIINYKINLTTLSLPTMYRLTLSGTAIKKGSDAPREKSTTTSPTLLPS